MPFRYLGVPVTANRISALDCRLLVEKTTRKIATWATRNASYAGRVALINSVLMGIYTFWATIFMLPKSVIKEVNSKCRNFLRGADQTFKKIPYISWEESCKPKSYGGLGPLNIEAWNSASIAKLVWAVSHKEDMLWVKWIHGRYLRNSNWWDYSP